MALQSNGQLLIRHATPAQAAATALAAPVTPLQLADYTLEPLFPGGRLSAFAAAAPGAGVVWSLARPHSVVQQNPWDVAHHAATQLNYTVYVEPDILHDTAPKPPPRPSPGVAPDQLNAAYPPAQGPLSPAWHLGQDFTGFLNIRRLAAGQGVRIAHLDTGYTPRHDSTPRHMRADLGWNFWDNNDNTVDPGTDSLSDQPGHGTATLAILAGTTVDLRFGTERYQGDFGGAPEAEVVPVRIGPSVIHFYSSTVARGLNYALAPRNDARNRCAVVSLSHGGLPSAAWATAVNALYQAGITVVAASGDCLNEGLLDLATRFTVYPAAFNRVITALGATYTREPYRTTQFNVMQGCWGPDAVMEKAVAGFTPNIAWMDNAVLPAGFEMNGGGTSASTPQIAAACALWLQLYGARFPADWRVAEACRLALFRSCDATTAGRSLLGWGTLNVPNMLDANIVAQIEAELRAGTMQPSSEDDVSFPFWRLLVGEPPDGSAQEAMYETEVAQIVLSSHNPVLLAASQSAANRRSFGTHDRAHVLAALLAEPLSGQLTKRVRTL